MNAWTVFQKCISASGFTSCLGDPQAPVYTKSELSIITVCNRITAAGKTATLSRKDVNHLIQAGNLSTVTPSPAAAAIFLNAVSTVSQHEENCTLLGDACSRLVMGVMSVQLSVKVQACGCKALAYLHTANLIGRAAHIPTGAIACVNRAWGILRDTPNSKGFAILAICAFATSASIQALLHFSWLDHVLVCMGEDVSNTFHQGVCCMTLAAFVKLPPGKTAMLADERTLPLLKRARETHPTDAKVQKYSAVALSGMKS